MLYRLLLCSVWSLLFCQEPTAQGRLHLAIGDKTPPLAGQDIAGEQLAWEQQRFAGRATLIYFHSSTTRFSRRGLQTVIETLTKSAGLPPRVAVLVVSNRKRTGEELAKLTAAAKIPTVFTVDAARDRFTPYRVIAYPTVFVITPKRKILHVIKGYGPLFPTRVLAGARHAAGLIDRAGHDALIGPDGPATGDETRIRINRHIAMARQLIAIGDVEPARAALARVLTLKSKHAGAVTMMADLLLRLERKQDARPWLERLRELEPGSAELPYLDTTMAILDGDANRALQLLDRAAKHDSRSAYLRGRALQSKGEFKAAAQAYEAALREIMRRRVETRNQP